MRAACVCKWWRRVITDSGDEGRAFFQPSSASTTTTPAAITGSCPSRRGRFSVDKYSSVADCRGGLVLLHARYWPCARSVPDLVVYDPLTRTRWSISRPCPPNNQDYRYCIRDVFLLDGDDGKISISNFRVLYWLDAAAATGPQACVFSTANGGEWDWLFSIDVNKVDMRVCCQSRQGIFSTTRCHGLSSYGPALKALATAFC
jgi:hypothetical protein